MSSIDAGGDNPGGNTRLRNLPWAPKSHSDPKVTLNLPLDAENYNMNHRSRGKCIIISNKKFDLYTKRSERHGTTEDAEKLYMRFRELDFDVKLYEDKKKLEILDILLKESEQDHTDEDSFVCCILTHGDRGNIYGIDNKFPVDKIFKSFQGDACPSLVGKPKLFFIQACEGDTVDNVKVSCSTDESINCKIPTHADFLVAYSTVPGFYSWKKGNSDGSWFIQVLCYVIEHYRNRHILDMLRIVIRIVAYCFESCIDTTVEMNMKKQVPFITSTLTRKVYFPAKLGQTS